MSRIAVQILAGVALFVVQMNLHHLLTRLHVGTWIPALPLPVVLYLGVRDIPIVRGAAISFGLGYATDLIGVAPVGLYTFTFVACFVIVRAASLRIAAQTRWIQILLTAGLALIESVMVLTLLAIFGADAYVPRALFPLVVPHLIATGLMAPIVIFFADRLQIAAAGPRSAMPGGMRE